MPLSARRFGSCLEGGWRLRSTYGPAFRQGLQVPSFPNVDVYPLMTHLLAVPAVANDGDYSAMKGMLKPDAQ